jgi:N-methylhydantoinase A
VKTIADAMGLDSVGRPPRHPRDREREHGGRAAARLRPRRHDPREFALVAYGGAGPLHANAVAEIMGSFPVLVPPAPGVLCAIGDLVADFRDEFAQTYIRVLADASPAEVGSILEGLGERAAAWLDGEGIPSDARSVTFTADMRYHRQGYEIPVAIDPADVRANGLAGLEERFNALHEQLYGFRMPGTAAEIVNLRSIGSGAVSKPELPTGSAGGADASGAVTDEHEIVFRGDRVPTRIYDRAHLAPGMRFDGPAIVTEFDSTTVVLPGYAAEIDVNFNILINPKA